MVTSEEIRNYYDNQLEEDIDSYYSLEGKIKNSRHRFIINQVAPLLSQKTKILEVGCGIGAITNEFSKIAPATGIDISPKKIDFAKKHYRGQYLVGDITRMKLSDEYDIILFPDSIEHIPKEKYPYLFPNILKALKRGGYVIFSFPNPKLIVQLRPEQKQIIDEAVEIKELQAHLRGLELVRFLEFGKIQMGVKPYIYAVFKKDSMNILFLSHSIVRFRSLLPEELTKRGHKVTLVASRIKKVKIAPEVKICRLPITSKEVTKEMVKALPEEKYDVIYACGDTTCKAGAQFKKLLKIPLFSQAEWVPPFRVGLEDSKEWGYHDSQEIDIEGYKRYYQKIFHAWLKADRKTLAGRDMVAPLERFLGVKIECDFFYPVVEIETTDKLFNKKAKEKYQIITIARLMFWKRIHMTIEALSLLDNPPLLVIIGAGKEKRFLKRLAKKKRVRCKFLGEFSGEKKFRIIQESMFGVQIWSGIPPAEELLMGKPCITFDVPYMRELYGDTLEYVPNNNVPALARKIQFLINNQGELRSKVESARQQIISHKLKIDTVANRALLLEKKLVELVGGKRD